MPKVSKFSPDEGITIYDLKDSASVHYGEQSKGYVNKNIIPHPYFYQSITMNGVTFTINDDWSITVNGTSTAATTFWITENKPQKKLDIKLNTSYKILTSSPIPQGVYFSVTHGDNGSEVRNYDVTNENTYADFSISSGYIYATRIYIGANRTVNNLTIYPMIQLGSITNHDYEPFIPSNSEIENKLSYTDNTILGAKNFIDINRGLGIRDDRGIVWTVNFDGTVVANGTAIDQSGGTEPAYIDINQRASSDSITFKKGIYRFSCLSQDALSHNCRVDISITKNSSTKQLAYVATTEDTILNVSEGDDFSNDGMRIQFRIIIPNGQTVTNLVFKPMLRLASDIDNTFSSYTMTNRMLTELLAINEHVLSSDYSDKFDWALSRSSYVKYGHICQVRISDLKCLQAVTLSSWGTTQFVKDLPTPIKGRGVTGTLIKNRIVQCPIQIDKPSGVDTYGIRLAQALECAANDLLYMTFVYICE